MPAAIKHNSRRVFRFDFICPSSARQRAIRIAVLGVLVQPIDCGLSTLQVRSRNSSAAVCDDAKMSSQDLLDLLRSRPFKPLRLYATDGRIYEINHPDQALVLRSRVILPLSSTPGTLPDAAEHLALIHIIRAEEIGTDSATDGVQ
jgi:hypothetical protein